jgi:hypothetical protein
MKRQLYLYLFILSALITAFTYMYFTKALAFERNNNKSEIKSVTDSLALISDKLNDADYFSLDKNERAQEYFENQSIQKLIPRIKEALLDYNDDSKGNIYTGQEKLGAQKFIINKIKILNHRWIIADYSDGTYWGDVVIKYFVESDGKITFQVMDSFIYPKEQY